MFRYLCVEFYKLNRFKALVFGFLLIALISIGVSIVEFRYIHFGKAESFYINYMLHNAASPVTRVFIPMLNLFFVASTWGGEYANGMIKSFLLCKVSRLKLFIGKFILIIFGVVASNLMVFVIFTVIGILKNGVYGITLYTILDMAKVYALLTVGLLPIILLTINICILLGDFQKGFIIGGVILLLSLSLDTVFKTAYITPTYLLSHSAIICDSTISSIAIIAFGLYTIGLTLSGFVIFNKMDIWQ